ncbi:MAG: 50S ribosomal protein L29 [Alphaproteobacteria bacterium]
MKTAELRTKSKAELKELVLNLKKEQFNLRFQAATGALENLSRFKDVRRTIARAKTLIDEPEGVVKAAPKAKKEKTTAAPKKAAAKKTKAKE